MQIDLATKPSINEVKWQIQNADHNHDSHCFTSAREPSTTPQQAYLILYSITRQYPQNSFLTLGGSLGLVAAVKD